MVKNLPAMKETRVWSKTMSWLLKVYSINKYLLNTGVVLWASLVAQMVKNLPAMQETQILSRGREDPLEKEMATHSSILAWEIPMDRGAWQATVHGVAKELDTA